MDDMHAPSGRLAVWCAQADHGAVQLRIDLDFDQTLEVRIGPDGVATTTVSDRFTEWLTSEAVPAA